MEIKKETGYVEEAVILSYLRSASSRVRPKEPEAERYCRLRQCRPMAPRE